jgi:hypothetical protein
MHFYFSTQVLSKCYLLLFYFLFAKTSWIDPAFILRIAEQGAEEDIWTEEECGDGRMEKIAKRGAS